MKYLKSEMDIKKQKDLILMKLNPYTKIAVAIFCALYGLSTYARSDQNYGENFASATNLVPNAGFESAKPDSSAQNWRPFFKTHPRFQKKMKKTLTAKIVNDVKRSGNSSLLLTNSEHAYASIESLIYSIVDPTKNYQLEGWIKCENATGAIFLEIVWFRDWLPMGFGWESEERNYGSHWSFFEEVGVSRSKITSGTHDWKHFSVTSQPPKDANLARFRIWAINNTGKVWIDDLNFDGFGADPMQICLSQAGFSKNGLKKAIIQAKYELKNATFTLTNAKTGEKVHRAPLSKWGPYKWNRINYIADFTDFVTPGIYTLKIEADNAPTTETPTFEITNDFYGKIADKLRHFMNQMRCGVDIAGFHKACHKDDGQIRKPTHDLTKNSKIVGHVDLSGGWHDAGDYDKYVNTEIFPIMGFADCYGVFENVNRKEKFLNEAAWGAEHLAKAQHENGGVYYKIQLENPKGQIKMYYTPPENETDNIVGTTDDRVATGPGLSQHQGLGLAKYAKLIKEKDKKKSQEFIKKAILASESFINYKSKMEQAGAVPNYFPALTVTETLLYELTGDEKFKKQAQILAKAMIDELATGNYKKIVPKWSISHDDNRLRGKMHFNIAWALIQYAKAFPIDSLTPDVKKVVKTFIDDVFMSPKQSPYGQLPLSWHYTSLYQDSKPGYQIPIIAAICADASVLLNDQKLFRFAEHMFQHCTGLNPLGISQISGVGWKTNAMFAWSSSCPDHQNGIFIPGAMSKGIWLGDGNVKASYRNLIMDPTRNIDHPRGFPAQTVASDYPVNNAFGHQEVFELPVGYALMAIADLKRAEEHFQKKSNLTIKKGGERK